MRLLSVTLSDIRRFTSPVTLDGIGPGLNVLSAPNEEGKSTLFDALHALFFQKHRGKPKEIIALRPHSGGAPLVSAELETDEGRFRITKRWLSRPMAEVRREGRLVAKADEAEDWIARLTDPPETGGPAGLLWVRQGLVALDQGDRRELDATQRARRDLLSSVAGEVETLTGGRRMERALAACEAELRQLVTATGKSWSGGPLKAAEDEAATLETRIAELARLAEDLGQSIERRRALRAERAELQDPEAVEARKTRLAMAEQAAATARTFAETRDRAAERLRSARLLHDNAAERLADLKNARAAVLAASGSLTECSGHAEDAIRIRTEAEAALSDARETLEARREALAGAQDAHNTAQKALRARESAARRAELTARLAEARRYAAEAQTLAAAAESGPDSKTLETLEDLARDWQLQRDLHSRTAPRLRMDYATGAETLSFGETPLPDGAEVALERRIALDLPGLGRLTVTPGTATEDDSALSRAGAALNAALSAAGVASLDEARAAARTRADASASRKEALAALRAVAPDGTGTLETVLAALPEPPGTDAPQPDPGVAEAALGAAQAALDRSEQRFETARAQDEAARIAEVRATARREDAAQRLARAQEALPDDPGATEAALAEELSRGGEAVSAAERTLAELDAEAPDLDGAEAALARAQDVVMRAGERLRAISEQQARLDAEIELRAGEGVEEELAAAREALDRAEARKARLEMERDALLRLKEALESARTEAREHYFEPVTRELAPLLRLLWPGAELVFDEDTVLPVRLIRDGVEEEIGQLSGGTREQIALLVRLAFARLLARSGQHAPVILDDALVYTDDARIERMFDALHRQAGDLQILVLTCRQRAFRDLGGRMLDYAPGTLPDGAE